MDHDDDDDDDEFRRPVMGIDDDSDRTAIPTTPTMAIWIGELVVVFVGKRIFAKSSCLCSLSGLRPWNLLLFELF